MTNAAVLPTIDLDNTTGTGLARIGSGSMDRDLFGEAPTSGYWSPMLEPDRGANQHAHLSIKGYGTEYDDPVVVSDDNPAFRMRNARIQRMQAMHSHFALHPIMERGLTESIVFQEKASNRSAAEKYGVLISAVLGATTVGMLTSPAFAALPAVTALQYIGNAKSNVVMGQPATVYPALLDATRQYSLMNSYRAILDPVFGAVGFDPTDNYEDGIGGLIVDYLRAEARICVALADEQIQFIYKKEDAFTSQVFDHPELAKISVLDFVQNEFS